MKIIFQMCRHLPVSYTHLDVYKRQAYHNKSISQTAFVDAYRNLKRNFAVTTYKAIKRKQVDVALRIAMEYEPPLLDVYKRQIKYQFDLRDSSGKYKSYKALQRKHFRKALELVKEYDLPIFLKEKVENENAQINLEVA